MCVLVVVFVGFLWVFSIVISFSAYIVGACRLLLLVRLLKCATTLGVEGLVLFAMFPIIFILWINYKVVECACLLV